LGGGSFWEMGLAYIKGEGWLNIWLVVDGCGCSGKVASRVGRDLSLMGIVRGLAV
jgi:hypothetical protein